MATLKYWTGAAWADVDVGGNPLTVTDESGTVSDTDVTSITVPDGTLVDNGTGDVTLREVPAGVIAMRVERQDSNLVMVATTSPQVITMDTVVYDPEGFSDLGGANPTRYTVPAGMSGWYVMDLNAYFTGIGGGALDLKIMLNGVTNIAFVREEYVVGVDLKAISTQYWLDAGDYVEGIVTSTSDTSFTLMSTADATSFSMVKVGSGTVGEAIGVRAYNNSAIGSLAATTYNKLNMDSEEWDTDGFHSTVSNTSRITIPAGLAGKYLVRGSLYMATVTANPYIYLNGNPIRSDASETPDILTISCVLDLAAGDYIELGEYHSSGTGSAGYADTSPVLQIMLEVMLLATQGSGGLKEGTAFPTGPATGTRYRRTDLDYAIYFYDGTRWLSEVEYATHSNLIDSGSITSTRHTWFPLPADYSTYFTRWDVFGRLGSTSGSWTVSVDKEDYTGSPTEVCTKTFNFGDTDFHSFSPAIGEEVDGSGAQSGTTPTHMQGYFTEDSGSASFVGGFTLYHRRIAT